MNVIVAFSRMEDARNIRNILTKGGVSVNFVCTSGAQVLSSSDGLNGGIVVSGFRFEDMMYHELYECLPSRFEMILVASPVRWSGQEIEGVIFLPLPLKVHDLLSTVDMVAWAQIRMKKKQRLSPSQRSGEEREIIEGAKALLMERNGMTEAESHRYIQKCSMDSGTDLVETSRMVLSLMNM